MEGEHNRGRHRKSKSFMKIPNSSQMRNVGLAKCQKYELAMEIPAGLFTGKQEIRSVSP